MSSTKAVNIKKELEKYPPEIHETIKLLALAKMSRDDIGSKVSVWHLGKHKGALKINLGAQPRPSGVLASILYHVGKNSAEENHRVLLDIVDMTGSNIMDEGRPANPAEWHDHTKWTEKMNAEVVRAQAENDNFRAWSNPQWPSVNFQRFQCATECDDFPPVAHFMNQGENALSTGHYVRSREAMLAILEKAINSRTFLLSFEHTETIKKVKAVINLFNSEIGKVLSYLDQPYQFDTNGNVARNAHGEPVYVDAAGNPTDTLVRFPKSHELILACYEYLIANLLMAVPGKIDRFNAVSLDLDRSRAKYVHLLEAVKETIVNEIQLNDTLKGWYQRELVGWFNGAWESHGQFVNQYGVAERTGGFANQERPDGKPIFMRIFRDEDDLRIKFQDWRIRNDRTLSKGGFWDRNDIYDEPPEDPLNAKEGWKATVKSDD